MGTKEIGLVAAPGTGPPSVDPRPPVPILLAMALTAKAVGLLESYRSAAGQMQLVPVLLIVAIQAPAILLIVSENDVGVKRRQLSPVGIRRHHAVTRRAREDSCGKGWWRDFHPFLGEGLCLHGRGGLADRLSLGRWAAATRGQVTEKDGHFC